jgi:hypothetical protein
MVGCAAGLCKVRHCGRRGQGVGGRGSDAAGSPPRRRHGWRAKLYQAGVLQSTWYNISLFDVPREFWRLEEPSRYDALRADHFTERVLSPAHLAVAQT